MMGMAIVCGQCAMLLLAMGSLRGSSIFFRKTATPLLCRCLQAAGIVLLGLSFFLQIHTMETPSISAVTWIGLISIEIVLTTVICAAIVRVNNI